jgi:hypothetical protein
MTDNRDFWRGLLLTALLSVWLAVLLSALGAALLAP